MQENDPDHWLYRLTPEEWLRAADRELALSRGSFASRQQRAAVTYARRAAGMALNALLFVSPDPLYGRSYMEHLKGLRADGNAPEEARTAAERLLTMPLAQEVVVIGRGKGTDDHGMADPAATILAYVRSLIAPPVHA